MNFIARSEDDSKLFYFFAKLQDGPYPNYHDVKEMCFEEDFKEPQPSDFQVKELCSLETHDSGKSLYVVTMLLWFFILTHVPSRIVDDRTLVDT